MPLRYMLMLRQHAVLLMPCQPLMLLLMPLILLPLMIRRFRDAVTRC